RRAARARRSRGRRGRARHRRRARGGAGGGGVSPREDLSRVPAEQLWARYRGGDVGVRNELISRYIGLVHHHALIVVRRTRELELEELVSAGTVGLVQALEGFDPTR